MGKAGVFGACTRARKMLYIESMRSKVTEMEITAGERFRPLADYGYSPE